MYTDLWTILLSCRYRYRLYQFMIGLRAAHHEPTYHLTEANIHLLLDKYDAMKVIWH